MKSSRLTSLSDRLTQPSPDPSGSRRIEGVYIERKGPLLRAQNIHHCGRAKSLVLSSSQNASKKTSFDFTKEPNTSANQTHGTFTFDLMVALLEEEETLSASEQKDLPEEFFIYDELLEILWKSPAARSILRFAARQEWSVTARTLETGSYMLNAEQKILVLNDHSLKKHALGARGYFRHAFLLSMIRGLRDMWHLECRQPHHKGLNIDSILMLERVRMADCDMIAQYVAWELRGEGYADLWRHLIGSPEGDMALAYSRALEHNPSTAFDNGALVYAFRQWFADESRVEACDHMTLDMIDEDLNDPDTKSNYGYKAVTPHFLESLSRLPDQTHYLSGYGQHIMDDPHYAGLGSEVNQTHYMQVLRDLETTTVGHVSFRDGKLAALIFPEGKMEEESDCIS